MSCFFGICFSKPVQKHARILPFMGSAITLTLYHNTKSIEFQDVLQKKIETKKILENFDRRRYLEILPCARTLSRISTEPLTTLWRIGAAGFLILRITWSTLSSAMRSTSTA